MSSSDKKNTKFDVAELSEYEDEMQYEIATYNFLNTFFSTTQAVNITGLTLGQVKNWRRKKYLVPTVDQYGKGKNKYYSYQDLYYLWFVKYLIDMGVKLEIALRILRYVQNFDPNLGNPYTSKNLRLICYVCCRQDHFGEDEISHSEPDQFIYFANEVLATSNYLEARILTRQCMAFAIHTKAYHRRLKTCLKRLQNPDYQEYRSENDYEFEQVPVDIVESDQIMADLQVEYRTKLNKTNKK